MKPNEAQKAAIDAHLRMLCSRLYGELIGTLEAMLEMNPEKLLKERIVVRIAQLKKECNYED